MRNSENIDVTFFVSEKSKHYDLKIISKILKNFPNKIKSSNRLKANDRICTNSNFNKINKTLCYLNDEKIL